MAEIGVRIVGEDQASAALRAVAESSRSTAQEVSSLGGAWGGLGSVLTSSVVKAQAIIGIFQGTISAIGNATAGIRSFMQQSEQMNQSLEGTRMAFTILIGSQEQATKLLDEMKVAARSTVLSFEEFRNASKYLLGFQFDAKDVVQITKDIGAAVYALGAQNMGGMERIIRALGQMKSQGRVSREELNQLAEVGVPALKMLADSFGVTTAEMNNMIKSGTIPVESAITALLGKFRELYGSQTGALSNSFEVMTSNFGDFVDQAQQALGAGIFETNKRRLQELTQIVASPVFMKVATELGGRIGEAYRRFNDTAVMPAIQAVGQFMQTLDMQNPRPAIMNLLDNLGGVMDNVINQYLGGAGLSALRQFSSMTSGVAQTLVDLFAVTDKQGRTFRFQFGEISQYVATVTEKMSSVFGPAIQGIQQMIPLIRGGIDEALNAFQQLGQGISTAVNTGNTQDLMNSLTSGLSSAWNFLDTWGARALDILAQSLDRLFKVDFNESPFISRLSEIIQRSIGIIGQIGGAIANSVGEQLFPQMSPRLQALGSWMQGQFGIIVSGIGSYMQDRLPGAFEIAFNTAEVSFQNWFARLGQTTKQGLADWLMPNLAGSQMFSDYMSSENARLEAEATKRNQILQQNNMDVARTMQQLPSIGDYFQGLGDTSSLTSQFEAIQQSTAPEARMTGEMLYRRILEGALQARQSATQQITDDTSAALSMTASELANSAAVGASWENVGRNIAVSMSRGYQSGYSEFVNEVQTSIGIPDIMNQLSDSVSAINNVNSRVYALESQIASRSQASTSTMVAGAIASPSTDTAVANTRSGGSVNNTNTVYINVTASAEAARDIQSMAQYLNVRNAFFTK